MKRTVKNFGGDIYAGRDVPESFVWELAQDKVNRKEAAGWVALPESLRVHGGPRVWTWKAKFVYVKNQPDREILETRIRAGLFEEDMMRVPSA